MAPDANLQLSPDDMRSLGYRVVDMLVSHFETLPGKPVSHVATRPAMEALFREPPPEEGQSWEDVLLRVQNEVFSHMMHVDHPRFLAFVSSPNNFVGAMADALTAGMNPFTGTWMEASGPTQIELVTIDWLRELCGMPDTAGGLFVSGGSMANITGLAVARHIRLGNEFSKAKVYLSDQTHSSVARGLRVLGFAPSQITVIPSDEAYRLPIDQLIQRIATDRAAGYIPFCVIANAGTTNTGAIDPLEQLSELCNRESLWLHADGAFGAAAVFCKRGKELLNGLRYVDSLSLDPHKWLFQPYECGVVLVRQQQHMRETFHVLPEYLQDLESDTEETNLYDYGIQLTRSFRALKLWMSLQVFGMAAFREAVARGFELAEFAEHTLRERPNWEIVTPAQMGVITFRHVPNHIDNIDDFTRRLVEHMIADGFALVMSTVLKGKTVLRFCTINPRTREDDISGTIDKLTFFAEKL